MIEQTVVARGHRYLIRHGNKYRYWNIEDRSNVFFEIVYNIITGPILDSWQRLEQYRYLSVSILYEKKCNQAQSIEATVASILSTWINTCCSYLVFNNTRMHGNTIIITRWWCIWWGYLPADCLRSLKRARRKSPLNSFPTSSLRGRELNGKLIITDSNLLWCRPEINNLRIGRVSLLPEKNQQQVEAIRFNCTMLYAL